MTEQQSAFLGPHQGQPVRTAGEPIGQARAAVLMVHGRGARAEDILSLAAEISQPGFAFLAPQASDNAWYPHFFREPLSRNEPWLTSALSFVESVLSQITAAGVPFERTLLLGFSQGACLSLEFASRHARRYGGVVGLSGGLIGPDDTPRDYAGSLAGTAVFLGCSDVDPYIPKERVESAASELRRLGGDVTQRLYPNLAHTINQDEIDHVRQMMNLVLTGG
jgi:phospholipase/carboxylesterase